MNSYALYLQLTLILPFMLVFGIVVTRHWPNFRETVTLFTSLSVFCLSLLIYQQVIAGNIIEVVWAELLPGLAIHFKVDALGIMYALIASFLWFVTTLYAIGYMRGHNEQNQTRFYACFAVAIGAVMGIAFAENLFTLFIFYEVLTLCTYPLVTHAGTEKAKQGGRIYLGILIGTSILFLLPAVIITWAVAGNLSFTAGGVFDANTSKGLLSVLFALFVFGIGKAAIMPIHRWLPSAMVAPTPVSALLHAVAVVKAGVFTLLKVSVFIFGIDLVPSLAITQWLIYLAGFTILVSSLIAMRKDNLKARLAYSTISQLSYIILGALIATSLSINGSAMHIAMHAFGKITLFFCAGAILVALHKSNISEMRGIGYKMPVTMIAFFIGSLSIIGLPPTGGTWSKWYLLMATIDTKQFILMAVLMISSLLNIAYLLSIPVKAFMPVKEQGGESLTLSRANIKEAPLFSLIAIIITSLFCILLFMQPQQLFELAQRIV